MFIHSSWSPGLCAEEGGVAVKIPSVREPMLSQETSPAESPGEPGCVVSLHTDQKGPCLNFACGSCGTRMYLVVVHHPTSLSYTPKVMLSAWLSYHSD